MGDANDAGQNVALAVVAGVVAFVVAGAIALAAATPGTRPASLTAAAATAVPGAIERVFFEVDSEALSAEAQDALARAADAARADAGATVLISAFHAAGGDAARNAELAQRRALAVRHALEADGVAPDRLLLSRPERVPGGTEPREAQRVEVRVQ